MSKPLLLAIEDSQTQSFVLQAVCDRLGYSLVVAQTAAEGLEALASFSAFDIVFMDIDMADMTGFECAAKLRQLDRQCWRRSIIIALTAHALPGDRERCLASGMDDYLSKPYSIEDFREIVEKWLHRVSDVKQSNFA